eukprot:m.445219 g.445219  ORF g.445219 m.445219 type:complete len:407 (+) comp19197_c0_seq1:275-1495(+)
MGKRKSGKKGSGKKAGGKKAAATDDEPPPSAERFMEYQLDARTAVCKSLRDNRDDLFLENEELKKEIENLEKEGRKVMEQIREMETQTREAVAAESVACSTRVENARQALEDAEEGNRNEVAALKKRAAELEIECSERAEYAEGLQNHRRVLCAQWDNRLIQLKEKKELAIATFNADVKHLEKQFEQTRSRFDDILTTKIENAKAAASEAAITIQPVPDRLAYQDHGWLSYELEEQQQEYIRLSKLCSELEEANIELRRTVLGESEQRISPSRIGLRVRPASRQQSAPPVLRGQRSKPTDPEFVTAAANLKLFSHLALSGSAKNLMLPSSHRVPDRRRTQSSPWVVPLRDTQSAVGPRPNRRRSGGGRPQRPLTEQSGRPQRTLPNISPVRPSTVSSQRKLQTLAV